jgi:hypothetical protein
MKKTMYVVIVDSNNNFLKPKENTLIYQCLASNPEQCIMKLHHHVFLNFFPSFMHTPEKLAFRHIQFFNGGILRLGIK